MQNQRPTQNSQYPPFYPSPPPYPQQNPLSPYVASPMTVTLPVYLNQRQPTYHPYGYQYYNQHPYPYQHPYPHHLNYNQISSPGVSQNQNQGTNIMDELQRALMMQMNGWGFNSNHNQTNINSGELQNEKTPLKSMDGSMATPGQQQSSNKISMHQLLQKIDKECSKSQQKDERLSSMQRSHASHDNPIYSKMSKYWQKSKHVRSNSSHATVNNRNLNSNNYNEDIVHKKDNEIQDQIIKCSQKTIKISDSNNAANKRQFRESVNQNKQGSVQIKVDKNVKVDNLKVGLQQNIKKIKTQDSDEQAMRLNDYNSHRQEGQNYSNQHSEIIFISNQSSNVHKNLRKRIIDTNSNPQTVNKSIGIQVNLPPYTAPDMLSSSIRNTIRNIIQYSVVKPFESSSQIKKLQQNIEQIKRQELLRYFQLQKMKRKQIQIKLGHSLMVSIQESLNTSSKVSGQLNVKKLFIPKLNQSLIVSGVKNQENMYEQEDIMEESCVINKSSQVKYKKDSKIKNQSDHVIEHEIDSKHMLEVSYPPDQTSIKFTASNDQPFQHYNKQKQVIQSPTTRMPVSVVKDKQKQKAKQNANQASQHSKMDLTMSKIAKIQNIITSFSELRQIIAFQFKEFRKYIEKWVRDMIEVYDRLLMEKQQAIFVLQIQKISLEDKLRDSHLTKDKQKFQKPKQNPNEPTIIIIPPGQFPKIPSLHSYDSLTEQQSNSKNKKAYEDSKAWKQLSAIQQILSNQIYNIEVDRYREFNYLFNEECKQKYQGYIGK